MLRPKVFISSRLNLGSVRSHLKRLLESCGFEVDIYEKDLTPSSGSATYLHDILDADFVIFILDEHYGAPRVKTGRSGTHDEWEVAQQNRIPSHVYLKKPGKHQDPRQKEFIQKSLREKEISYYYFARRPELLKRARAAIAQMAIRIAESPRFRHRHQSENLPGDMAEAEYATFSAIHNAIMELCRAEDFYAASGEITDGWAMLSSLYWRLNAHSEYPFYDSQLQAWFAEFLAALKQVAEYESRWTTGSRLGKHTRISFPGGPIEASASRFPVLAGKERYTHDKKKNREPQGKASAKGPHRLGAHSAAR